MSYVGIALATALASWLNVSMLAITLHRRGHLKLDAQLKRNAPRALLCSLVMGAALRGGAWLLDGPLAGHVVVKVAALSVRWWPAASGLFFALAILSGAIAAGRTQADAAARPEVPRGGGR